MAFVSSFPHGGVVGRPGATSRNSAATVRPRATRSRRVVVCGIANVAEADFETEVLKSDVPVLVDFYANWCGPCKLVAPLLDVVANEYDGKLKVIKVDTEEAKSFVSKYKIQGLPTLTIFKEGEVVSEHEGAVNKAELLAMVRRTLPELAE